LFNDVDSGEYFNLFDSYEVEQAPLELEPAPLHAVLYAPGTNLSSFPATALVYDFNLDSALHDLPGVEGGITDDNLPFRDKEPEEVRVWFADIWLRQLNTFSFEFPTDWDADPRVYRPTTLA
jgi:hypothetical protein